MSSRSAVQRAAIAVTLAYRDAPATIPRRAHDLAAERIVYRCEQLVAGVGRLDDDAIKRVVAVLRGEGDAK